MFRIAASVAACCALSAGVAGCSVSEKIQPQAGATTTTSTTAPPTVLSPDLVTTSAPPSAVSTANALTAAAASKDLCALLVAINRAAPAASDSAGVVRVYEALVAAVSSARSFVPAELADSWVALDSEARNALTALKNAGGDRTDPDFLAAFESDEAVVAAEHFEAYQRSTCR